MLDHRHWHVLGAGSMGCLWGAYLALAGYRVTLLLRNHTALSTFPGYLDLKVGSQHRQVPVAAQLVTEPDELIGQLLVTVKAPDTLDALSSLAQRLDANTRMVLMQNGMGVAERIREVFPSLTVGIAVTTEGAYRTSPFQVIHAGHGQTWLDNSLQSLITFKAQDIDVIGDKYSLTVTWDDDIKRRQWNKLSINCAINALTALLDCHNGQLLQPPGPGLIRTLCKETALIMEAEGLEPSADRLSDTALAVAEATAANFSSMCQDLRRGVTTEIDYLNGYLLQRAAVYGLDLPCHRMLVEMIKLKTVLKR